MTSFFILNFRKIKIKKIFKLAFLFTVCLCFSSCNESPYVIFHTYQELSEYDFISEGRIPEILDVDAIEIRETYDITNKHIFGSFDFIRRPKYDSVIMSYPTGDKSSLLKMIKEIKKPRYPKWFIPEEDIIRGQYIIAKQKDFYLLMDKKVDRIYFLR